MIYKSFFASILILVSSLPIIAYSQVLKGTITDSSGNQIAGAAISILHKDTVITTTISDKNGEFEIQQLNKNIKQCGIIVSAMGFQPYKNDTIPLPTRITLNIYSLDEVIVIGKRPQMSIKKGNISIRISGTFLEKYPNLQTSLQYIPNLIIDDESLKIVGRGAPIILLDNKEIASLHQIYSLDPSNIESVEIDNNPSSKYDSQFKAVIKINTKKTETKKTGLSVYNHSILGRKYSNDLGIDFQSKLGVTENFITYRYKHTELLNYSTVEEISNIKNVYSDTISHNRNSHNLTIGSRYKISEKNTISIDYNFYNATNSPVYYNAFVNSYYNNNSQEPLNTSVRKTGYFRQLNHIINLFYDYKIDSVSNLILNLSYVNRPTRSIDKINQTGHISDFFRFNNKARSQSFMTNLDLTKSLSNGYLLCGGIRYSKIGYDNSMVSDSKDNMNTMRSRNNEQTAAIYLEANKQYGNIHLQVGGRVEWNKNKYGNNQTDTQYEGHFKSFNIFPAIEMNYEISPQFSLNGSYTSKIARPRFEQLSPIITYLTPYSYNIGNPELKPTINHNIALSSKILSKVSIGMEYTKNINEIIYTAINDLHAPDKLAYTSINISQANYFKYWAMYDNTFGFYELSTYAMLTTPFVKIPYKNEIITANKPNMYLSLSNKFAIGKIIDLVISFAYQSTAYSINTISKPSYNLSVGMNYSIDKNLTLCIFANDLLFRNYPTERTRFGNIETTQTYNHDMQRIKFSLVYRFNKYKTKYNSNRYNNDDIERM